MKKIRKFASKLYLNIKFLAKYIIRLRFLNGVRMFHAQHKRPMIEMFYYKNIIRYINNTIASVADYNQSLRVFSKPPNAIFELTNLCTLKCPLCNTGGLKDSFKHVKRGFMHYELFKKGIDKMLPQLQSILLYTWGEPLLNKDLCECIQYAYQNRIYTQISTNMMCYTHHIGENMIDAGLSKVIVSCDGLTQETYQKYRTGGELEKVIHGVKDLLELKKEKKCSHPYIEIQCIVFRHNENELHEIEKYWSKLGVDHVNFIKMSYMSGPGEKVAEDLKLVPINGEYQPHYPYGSLTRCSELYQNITIDWNGDCYTCCFPPGEQEYKLGNIVEIDNFYKMWNGEKYRYCRQLLKTKSINGKYFDTMCHDCTGVFPNENTKRYWKK